jgi:predicted ATPase
MLKRITLLRERVEDWKKYPFCVPVIRNFETLSFRSRIAFFAGENGTGKSTLLEAIASHYGFGPEGGNRNIGVDTTNSNHSIDPLVRTLRLSFDKKKGQGFFLRAESFFNAASYVDGLGLAEFYGGRSLHERSHGESFFTLLQEKFRRNGLFLMDEPESALSPQRQLAFLVLIDDTLRKYKDAQFIISSQSPILMGFPEAQIVSFDRDKLQEVSYECLPAVQIARRFLNGRDEFLHKLLGKSGSPFS